MKWKGHERVEIRTDDGQAVTAIAPLIISASRSTDIPAFYGDWFMERQKKGYVKWKSPFGGNPVYVSFAKARVFVFWSKDPAPFFVHLHALNLTGCRYYFLFTLNDYEREGLEPYVPPLDERIATFIRLSRHTGKERIVWRYDPLVLSGGITVTDLLEKIRYIGDLLHPFTGRLVISFVDIAKYKKVRRNLQAQGFSGVREFTDLEVTEFCEGLASLNERWGLTINACGERRDLSAHGIGQGQCISYDLMVREFAADEVLMDFLQPEGQGLLSGKMPAPSPARRLKDPGQRGTCGCIVSKDIGQYNTCRHLCAYCYANVSPDGVRQHYMRYLEDARMGVFHDSIVE
jgi:hypothetical protein